jgi:uncharacterized protein YeaO (DUF488 family)
MIYCKVVSTPITIDDGKRILIAATMQQDLMPNIMAIDLWLEALAPSANMLHWLTTQVNQPDEFRQVYLKQLASQTEHWLMLLDYARQGNLTLLCSLPEHLFYLEILAGFLEDELEKWQDGSSPVCYAGLKSLN